MSSYLLMSALDVLRMVESLTGLDSFPTYRQDGAREERSSVPFLLLFITFTLFVYILETYLDLRQHRRLHAKTPSSTLMSVLKRVDGENEGLGAVSKVSDFYLLSRVGNKFTYVTYYKLSKVSGIRCTQGLYSPVQNFVFYFMYHIDVLLLRLVRYLSWGKCLTQFREVDSND